MILARTEILPETELPSGAALLAEGRSLANAIQVGDCAFLDEYGVPSEAAFKEVAIANGLVTQHAQIGFRDIDRSIEAYARIHGACAERGVTVHRYGICLDWSMGYPRDARDGKTRGTGLILDTPEDFARLTRSAPVAPHFGDFVLGFPAAVENTGAALAAGATAIGNLGQYFTFRLPGHDDDIEATAETVRALGLIAGQEVDILVHSNLDDGFAALFLDLASSLGAVLIEKHIVETLMGCRLSHCFGHHFSDLTSRLAFQKALRAVTDTPGTMIYGNTVSYRGGAAENYASLAGYLMADIMGQMTNPSGHAVNAVPVMENRRIPDIDEIVDAQLFAGRLIERAPDLAPTYDCGEVDRRADRIIAGGRGFRDRVLSGLSEAGIDARDPFEMLLALRRIGSRRLERLFGAESDAPFEPSGVLDHHRATGRRIVDALDTGLRDKLARARLRILIATTDVHEHGKILLEETLGLVDADLVDGGVSVDPDAIVALARNRSPDCIAISTYNGVAMHYYRNLRSALDQAGLDIPVLVGGRLNQIPENSNTSLPVDVTSELAAAGAFVCPSIEDAFDVLSRIADGKGRAADIP